MTTHNITTRTSPFGYYATCSCGHITDAYRATAREAYYYSATHIAAGDVITTR